MGFFNFVETFFFISLAITFVLIMMLVYHFKGRITLLEQKCDTMFDIMNNIVKEMRTIKLGLNTESINPSILPIKQSFPFQFSSNQILGEMFSQLQDNRDDEDEYDEYNENEVNTYKKIFVSDIESEDDNPIKIINIDFDNKNNEQQNDKAVHLEELEKEIINIYEPLENEPLEDEPLEDEPLEDEPLEDEPLEDKPLEDEPLEDEPLEDEPLEDEPLEDEPLEDEPLEDNPLEKSLDYKKMDISYLRTMVITRGLATDTKKMKKNDLIKLLEDSK
jgi:hypothetical protein